MKINIESIHFTADKKLLDYTQKRVEKLEKIFSRIIDVDVHFRINKNNDKGNKQVDIKVNIPQNQFFAKEQASTFEEGVDNCVEALRRQIKKYKDKITNY